MAVNYSEERRQKAGIVKKAGSEHLRWGRGPVRSRGALGFGDAAERPALKLKCQAGEILDR
jgi:hypothetical protein